MTCWRGTYHWYILFIPKIKLFRWGGSCMRPGVIHNREIYIFLVYYRAKTNNPSCVRVVRSDLWCAAVYYIQSLDNNLVFLEAKHPDLNHPSSIRLVTLCGGQYVHAEPDTMHIQLHCSTQQVCPHNAYLLYSRMSGFQMRLSGNLTLVTPGYFDSFHWR